MIRCIMITGFLCVPILMEAQQLVERSGRAVFYSEAPVENIKAINEQVLAVVDVDKGEVAVSMLMKGFQFRKALMQEHFNESYVESDTYPKAMFRGKIQDYSPEIWNREGRVVVEGQLTIHGVTRRMTTTVKLRPEGDRCLAETKFMVRVADHNIDIPSVVADNIAQEVEVTINLVLKNYP